MEGKENHQRDRKSNRNRQRHSNNESKSNNSKCESPQLPKAREVVEKTIPNFKEKSMTRWSYYHDGDVKIPEICVYSIDKRCQFEEKGCERLHAKCTSQWQIKHGDNWFNFRNFHSIEIEDAYNDASRTHVVLSPIDPVKLGAAGSEMFKILGNDQWEADFETMMLRMKNSLDVTHEIRRLSTKSAALSKSAKATTYEWYFMDINNKWIKYGEKDSTGNHTASSLTSEEIEKQYVTDKSVPLTFNASKFHYSLNLETMQQINLNTKTARPVRRRPLKILSKKPLDKRPKTQEQASEKGDLPSIWKEMKDTETMILVDLDSSSKEYKDVMSRILVTLPTIKALSIQRVQNPFLLRAFQNKKKELSIKYGGAEKLNIQNLFHGTKEEYVMKISNENFDHRLHGANVGHIYGKGAYFSNSAKTSKCYSTANSSGHCHMFVADVIVGEITTGSKVMVRPPPNPTTGELYDTTVDNTSAPKIFVKYDKQEYCPLYIIEFV